MTKELIAKTIYEHWPTGMYVRVPTTTISPAYEKKWIEDTWEETKKDDPSRAEDCYACAEKIMKVLKINETTT